MGEGEGGREGEGEGGRGEGRREGGREGGRGEWMMPIKSTCTSVAPNVLRAKISRKIA